MFFCSVPLLCMSAPAGWPLWGLMPGLCRHSPRGGLCWMVISFLWGRGDDLTLQLKGCNSISLPCCVGSDWLTAEWLHLKYSITEHMCSLAFSICAELPKDPMPHHICWATLHQKQIHAKKAPFPLSVWWRSPWGAGEDIPVNFQRKTNRGQVTILQSWNANVNEEPHSHRMHVIAN